jgi:hypothetical protein
MREGGRKAVVSCWLPVVCGRDDEVEGPNSI